MEPAIEKLLEIKRHIKILQDLDDDVIREVVTNVSFQKYALNEKIIEQGTTSKHIFYLFVGKCDVFYNNQRVGEIEKGSAFGEISAIMGVPRIASVYAKGETKLIAFELDERQIRNHPASFAAIYKRVIEQLAQKLDHANQILLEHNIIL